MKKKFGFLVKLEFLGVSSSVCFVSYSGLEKEHGPTLPNRPSRNKINAVYNLNAPLNPKSINYAKRGLN